MISVIIPVYNTARYLPQCLDSVLGQDFSDLEVITVNDASTDDSLDVCRRYAARDSRVVVIDKPRNEGSEAARRSGYAVARGEYVMYADSDDWLDNPHVLSLMHDKAEETGADYVEIGFNRVLDRRKLVKKRIPLVSGHGLLIEQPELFDDYFISFFGVNKLFSSMCGKLYRKSTADMADIRPLGIFMQDDVGYNMQLFPSLKKIYILADTGYNYRFGGNTSRYYPFMPDYKRLYARKTELIEQYSFHKALPWVNIELKNVLRTEICNRIIFNIGGGRKAVVDWLREEMSDPVYGGFVHVDKASGFWQDPMVRAFAAGDAEAVYDVCLARVRSERPRRLLKQFMFKLLNLV